MVKIQYTHNEASMLNIVTGSTQQTPARPPMQLMLPDLLRYESW